MLVMLNPRADRGRAAERWTVVASTLAERHPGLRHVVAEDASQARAVIRHAILSGERDFAAAGGDGTVNRLVNDVIAVADPDVLSCLRVGAIGLGSSNDFHKLEHASTRIGGYPARLAFDRATSHDVGRVTTWDPSGRRQTRRWLINASIGTTAYGNWLYNRADGCVGLLKSVSASFGMAGAAAKAVLTYHGQRMTLESERGETVLAVVRNLGVAKNPHFTGCLKYAHALEADSGDFVVHVLADATLLRTLHTLWQLAHGGSSGRHLSSWRDRCLRVTSPHPFVVESDGETVVAARAHFQLEPFRLLVCP